MIHGLTIQPIPIELDGHKNDPKTIFQAAFKPYSVISHNRFNIATALVISFCSLYERKTQDSRLKINRKEKLFWVPKIYF